MNYKRLRRFTLTLHDLAEARAPTPSPFARCVFPATTRKNQQEVNARSPENVGTSAARCLMKQCDSRSIYATFGYT
jgi:hypothetical protein